MDAAAIRTAPAKSEIKMQTQAGAIETMPVERVSLAGFLAWLVPGLGHLYVGERARGLVLLVTVTATFWSGIAIGGVRGTVDPKDRFLWFLAQSCSGGNTAAAYLLQRAMGPVAVDGKRSGQVDSWLSVEVGVHFTGVAGLLNVVVILDALARAELAPGTGRRRRDGPTGDS